MVIRALYFALFDILSGPDADALVVTRDELLGTVLSQLPTLIYFSSYSLLCLFWAEIYSYATNKPAVITLRLRPVFLGANGFMYFCSIIFWVLLATEHKLDTDIMLGIEIFLAIVSFVSAVVFIVYGGLLLLMLRRCPVDERGRKNRLNEVGWVTLCCATCFLVRSAFLLDRAAERDGIETWIAWLVYFGLCEVVPTTVVLFILRKMPPDRRAGVNMAARKTYGAAGGDASYGSGENMRDPLVNSHHDDAGLDTSVN